MFLMEQTNKVRLSLIAFPDNSERTFNVSWQSFATYSSENRTGVQKTFQCIAGGAHEMLDN